MNIFIHYLDKEVLDIYYLPQRYSRETITKVCFSIKVALLLLGKEEYIYIPASNYFESNLAREVLEYFRDIVDLNYIRLVSSSSTLQGFVSKKKIVYPSLYAKEQFAEEEEIILEKNVPGIWTPRRNSATSDIISNWRKNIDDSIWSELYNHSDYKKIDSFERAMAAVPQKLDRKVFVADCVLSQLKVKSEYKFEAKEIINKVITKFYVNSFLDEYNAVCFKNFFLVPQADDLLPIGYSHIDYGILCRRLTEIRYEGKSLYSYINECNNYDLMLLRKQNILHDLLGEDLNKKVINGHKEEKKMKVFIVHGHDGEVKLSLKNYVQNTLKMEEPIVLAEKASGGLTIIEKFEKFSEECNLIFVLLTPDDIYSEDNKNRARQNVIFEMGYFLGKLGRKSGRVILLYKGNLELPNDISGLVYINIDNGIEAAGEQIRREIAEIDKML
jgi:predicted nucleotide-binding protein